MAFARIMGWVTSRVGPEVLAVGGRSILVAFDPRAIARESGRRPGRVAQVSSPMQDASTRVAAAGARFVLDMNFSWMDMRLRKLQCPQASEEVLWRSMSWDAWRSERSSGR